MKTILNKILEYIPEFFMFAPIALWIGAYFTKNPTLEDLFLRTWWWMFLGMAFSTIDIATTKSKRFL